MDPRSSLHTEWEHADYLSIVNLPVTVFVGINAEGARLLGQMGVTSVFDLANASVFIAAEVLVLAAEDSSHPFRCLGRVGADLVDGKGAQLPVEQWPLQPAIWIAGIGPALAPEFERLFDLGTISEVAHWGPYQNAKELVRLAAGGGAEPLPADPSTPEDLLPRNGQYPTDRVYYRSILLRSLLDQDQGQAIEVSGGLDLNLPPSTAATGPGYGAYVTWAQDWYGQAVVLGNLLHSLALAPGEATMVAIVDWTRTVSASTVESIDQVDSLSASTAQNRALSEVTQGVASEVQSGFSTTAAAGTTQSEGVTAGAADSASVTIPILGVSFGGGMGASYGTSSSAATSTTVAYTAGTRETFAEYAQNISESTQQQATSARSRRASVVQEIRESTTETLQTRVVANYNHMHAMSIHYYETLQIFRVVLQAARAEKCAFIPITPLDFSDDAVIDRFAPILRLVARDPNLVKVLATSIRASLVAPVSGAVYERLPSGPVIDVPTGPIPTPGRTAIAAGAARSPSPGSLDWWQTGNAMVAVEIPGPLQVALTSHFTTVSAMAGSDVLPITVTWISGFSASPVATAVDWPVLDVESMLIDVPESNAATEVDLELGITSASITQRYRITLPKSAGESDNGTIRLPALVVIGNEVSATELALARAHLIAEAAWYTARIWERIDITTITALLAQYRFQGKPLLSIVDPRLLAVTGTHGVFRILLDDAGKAAWIAELEEWGITGPDSRREDLVPLPTGGVFAEAVLGRANSAEKLDVTRFWNWQDSPPPFAPPAIAALQAGQQPVTTAPTTGQLDAPIINMVQPTPMPDPTGLAATLGLLQASNMFRDMSFAAPNIDAANAAGAASVAAQAAALNAAQQAFTTAAALATSASLTGALMNAAQDGIFGAKERLVPQPPPPPPPPPTDDDVPPPPPPTDDDVPPPPPPTDDDVPPPPPPTDDDVPPPPPPPTDDDQSIDGVATFDLALSVPYGAIRLDFMRGAIGVIPSEVVSRLTDPIEYIASWVSAVGFDSDGTTDSITQALTTLALAPAAPNIAALVALVEGLKAIVDFLGGEHVLSQETIDLVVGGLNDTVQLLQAAMFPCISGGQWMAASLTMEVREGVPVSSVNVPSGQIQYGFQWTSTPVEDGPWWAGNPTGFLDSLLIPITNLNLSTSATFDGTETLSAVVKADIPLALDWVSAVGLCSDRVKETVRRLLGVGGVLDHLASKGIVNPEAWMMASIDSWFQWWQDNFFYYLISYFVPEINFEFTVAIAPSTGWTITVTPKHDPFPDYSMTLRGRGDDGEPIDAYPFNTTSPLGPLSLIGDAMSYPSRQKPVASSAIGDWRPS